MDIYLDSDAKNLNYSTSSICTISKKLGTAQVYKKTVSFYDVINSEYAPLVEKDLVNPANLDVSCNASSSIPVDVYYDSDMVYYYRIDKSSFGCLKTTGYITNLPSECNG